MDITEVKTTEEPVEEIAEETEQEVVKESAATHEDLGQDMQNQAPMDALNEKISPFPSSDYKKDGRLKKVRGRMLGKLLKVEIRQYLFFFAIIAAVVLVSSVICALGLRSTWKKIQASVNENGEGVYIFPDIEVYIFPIACIVALVCAVVKPMERYNKNFFQNEGYLTFSLPATMEEQLWAKRIAALFCELAMMVVVVLSGLFVLFINRNGYLGELGQELRWIIEDIFYVYVANTKTQKVFLIIEGVLSFLITLWLVPSALGALCCLTSSAASKRKGALICVAAIIGVMVINSFFTEGFELIYNNVSWAKAIHIVSWIEIARDIAFTVLCILFEIWYLKNKLDLK